MKILIVYCGKGIYGGAEEVIVQLTNYLIKQGHGVALVLKDAPNKEMAEALDGLKFHAVLPTWSYLGLRKYTRNLLGWADVVNVHNFPATLAPFPTKKPIVWMCNEPAEMFTNWWRKPIEAFNRWWVKKSGMKVVVADRFNARRFFDIYGVVPKIIPYGVDYGFWSNHIRERHSDSGFCMLQVGTVTPYKNQEASIRAVALLRESIPKIELVLAGPTDSDRGYYEKMEGLATELGVSDIVNYTGGINREQLREWYYKADILLHPVKAQGGWLVPFEAMCTGLPVIVSEEFTGADTIRGNGLGIVTNDYVDAIKNSGGTTRNAGEWVRENLNWERFGEGMLEVFKEAISERCF